MISFLRTRRYDEQRFGGQGSMEARLVRAARALLGLSQRELAQASLISWSSINSFERERTRLSPRSQKAIVAALEERGVIFLIGPTGVGVRQAKRQFLSAEAQTPHVGR